MSDTKKTNSTKTNSTKTNHTKKMTHTKINHVKMNSVKTNSPKMNGRKIKKSIGEVIEISLLLVAFGIVIEILFGGVIPMSNGILMNLIGLLNTLGDNGIIGLAVLGLVVYIFRKGKVFA